MRTPSPVRSFTVAHLNWEGDGITALYDGDKCVMDGDYYHDKIDSMIEGFFAALEHIGFDYERDDIYVSGEEFSEDICYAPQSLTELKAQYNWKDNTDEEA